MTYAVTVRVRNPIEAYDTTHAEVLKAAGSDGADGLILHVARALPEGFEVFEVWESREHAEKFNREVVFPAMERAGVENTGPEPQVEEFQPRTVLVPQPYSSEAG
jgi:serine/threonine protein kinase HipA of HipAB toxin-antitoxin module